MRHADWKEAEFFEELPAHLRGDVAAFLMEEVFEQSDFFRCLLDAILTWKRRDPLAYILPCLACHGCIALIWRRGEDLHSSTCMVATSFFEGGGRMGESCTAQ